MAEITFRIDGIEEFFREVDAEVDRIQAGMKDVVEATARELKAISQANAPKGETSLLVSSHLVVLDTGDRETVASVGDGFGRAIVESAKVQVLAPYAAAQNFGIPGETAEDDTGEVSQFQNPVQVRAHTRVITQAFGRTLTTPVIVNVRAHERYMYIPATLFFSNAVEEMRPRHLERVREVVDG